MKGEKLESGIFFYKREKSLHLVHHKAAVLCVKKRELIILTVSLSARKVKGSHNDYSISEAIRR